MEFERLLELVGDEPVFETALLLAGKVNPDIVRLQLTRWTNSGRVYQLRRGLYAIAPPYQKVKPHPFLIANRMQRASYVSGQSALAFYGLIPEVVPVTLSVTAGRPERLDTPLGIFEFRHVKPELLRGYRMTDLGRNRQASKPWWQCRKRLFSTWCICSRAAMRPIICVSCACKTWNGWIWMNSTARPKPSIPPSCAGLSKPSPAWRKPKNRSMKPYERIPG